jgi:BASS family bile acid:Na+ symporter
MVIKPGIFREGCYRFHIVLFKILVEITMNELIQICQSIFKPLVIIFTISNLFSMGLQINIPAVINKLKNPKITLLVLLWGWVVGPILAFLITKILPLAEPFVLVMLITSLAPSAPFLPPMIRKSRGDVTFTGAFIPLATVGTVIFMPIMAPLMIKGLDINAMAIAKPLVITVLIPLIAGALLKTFSEEITGKIFRSVKILAGLATALTVIFCFIIYTRIMIRTVGSYALVSMTIFMFIMLLLTYVFGFGLKQNERSVMSLGMGTRNIAAVFAGVLAIPDGDPRMLAMIVMWTIWSFIIALIISTAFGRKAMKESPVS